MNDTVKKIKEFCFHDSVVYEYREFKWDNKLQSAVLGADFCEEETERTGLKSYRFTFKGDLERSINGKISDYKGMEVIKLTADYIGGVYSIDLFLVNGSEYVSIQLKCKNIQLNLMKYKGMSYRNLYGTPELNTVNEKMCYVEDEKYSESVERINLPEGYILETKNYIDIEKSCIKAELTRNVLKKGDTEIFSYYTFDRNHRPFSEFIYHSNGHRYYPFYVNLYGICYLDADTLENYCYVPEGWAHDSSYPCGESFIITDVHYDKDTDLIAYGGCYWGSTSNIMIGDFSEPLHFNPHLIDIHDLGIDPDWEDGYDFDFVRWTKSALVIKDDNGKEYEVAIDKIKEKLVSV